MSTITRERAAQIAEGGGFNFDEIAELARIALASLEAEPAIHRWRRVTVEPYGPCPWHYGNFIGFSKPVEGIEDEYFTPPRQRRYLCQMAELSLSISTRLRLKQPEKSCAT